MINDDILIKFARSKASFSKINWPVWVKAFKAGLKEMKEGFPGLNNDHLSIIKIGNLQVGDIFILDYNLLDSKLFSKEKDVNNDVPIMFRREDEIHYRILGLGKGYHLSDPDRKLKVGEIISINLSNFSESTLIRVDVRPTENGGPGYYYFFKAYKDQRY